MPSIEPRKSKTGENHYRAKVRLRGYPPQYATFSRKSDAIRWAQRTEADLRDDKHFPSAKAKKHNVTDLINAYLDNLKTKNPRRYDEVKGMLDWWKEELGLTILSHFKSEAIVKAQKKLLTRERQRKDADGKARTLSPATVNRYMVALHSAVEFGIHPLEWISTNPLKKRDKLKEFGRTRFLSMEEVDRLLAACKRSKNAHLHAIVIMALCTGARRAEIQYMKWVHVSADITRITLPKTKNGEVRAVYLTGAASMLVSQMRDAREEGQIYLFPSPNDPNRPIDFESAWSYAVEEAELADFRFHDLRHTCGSYLAMNGASTVEIMEVLGHKTLAMAGRYAHLTNTHTSNVVGKMTERMLGHVEI